MTMTEKMLAARRSYGIDQGSNGHKIKKIAEDLE